MRIILITINVAFILFSQIIFGQSIPKSLFVVNTLGENLSIVNLENHTVYPNAVTLGLYAYQIKIRGEIGCIVNSGLNELQIINLHTNSTIHQIPLGIGTNPYNMDFINDSLAAVSLLITNQTAIVNVNNGQIVQNVSVGGGPEGVKYYNGKIYITNTNFNGSGYDPGTVSVIDATTFSVINTITVGTNPQSVDVDTSGNLIVSCTGDYVSVYGQLDVVDLQTGLVTSSVPLDTFITSVFVNSNNKAYISTYGFGVMVYNLNSQTFERDEANPLPGGPGCVFDNLNNCYIVDFNTDSMRAFSENHIRLNSYLVGDGPVSVDVYNGTLNKIVKDNSNLLQEIKLFQNYPNPFNPETHIKFYLSKKSDIQLTVFNLQGQEVYSVTKKDVSVGYNTFKFDGSNFSSGTYLYKLKAGNNIQMRKMVLIK